MPDILLETESETKLKNVVEKLQQKLEAVRIVFEPLWSDFNKHILPFRDTDAQMLPSISTPNTDASIYSYVGIQANQRLADGLMTHLTPYTDNWLNFKDGDFRKNKDPVIQKFYAESKEVVDHLLKQSNFYLTSHEARYDRSGYGQECIINEDTYINDNKLKFTFLETGSYWVIENSFGLVDGISTKSISTNEDLIDSFGVEALSEKTKQNYQQALRTSDGSGINKFLDEEVEVIHMILPKRYEKFFPLKNGNHQYHEIYYDRTNKKILRTGGYYEQPFTVSRFRKWGKLPYGYCPSAMVLPDIKSHNELQADLFLLEEARLNPRMLIPSSIDENDVDISIGGTTVFDESNPNSVPRTWMDAPNAEDARVLAASREDNIKKAFLNDLFVIFDSEETNKTMSASEATFRRNEKLGLITPTLIRQKIETFDPQLSRVFSIALRHNLLPEIPEQLIQFKNNKATMKTPEIVITSRIGLALEAEKVQTFFTILEMIKGVTDLYPDAVDNFNLDGAIIDATYAQNAPSYWVRDEKNKTEIRESREQMQQLQQIAETGKTISEAEKNFSQAGVDESALLAS